EDMGMMGIVNVVPDDPITATGSPEGTAPQVTIYDQATGQEKTSFLAFDPNLYQGGVRVAVANLYGDDRQQIIVGASSGNLPMVRVFDAATGMPLPGLLGS